MTTLAQSVNGMNPIRIGRSGPPPFDASPEHPISGAAIAPRPAAAIPRNISRRVIDLIYYLVLVKSLVYLALRLALPGGN
jgi:hypothetical protein